MDALLECLVELNSSTEILLKTNIVFHDRKMTDDTHQTIWHGWPSYESMGFCTESRNFIDCKELRGRGNQLRTLSLDASTPLWHLFLRRVHLHRIWRHPGHAIEKLLHHWPLVRKIHNPSMVSLQKGAVMQSLGEFVLFVMNSGWTVWFRLILDARLSWDIVVMTSDWLMVIPIVDLLWRTQEANHFDIYNHNSMINLMLMMTENKQARYDCSSFTHLNHIC